MINVSKLYCGKAGQSDSLRYPGQRDTKPILVFNCTARCNLKCLHCYSSSDSSRKEPELTTPQARLLIDQAADFGCPVLLFSGGEPLLRKDLFDLIAYAGQKGLRTVLSTNGTLITPQAAEKLAALNLSYAGISLDGPADLHDRFRGVEGSFAATMKGIANCRKAQIRTGLRFTMTCGNMDQIPEVFRIALDTGIGRICFYHLIPTGRAEHLSDQMPTELQTRKALDTIIKQTDRLVLQNQVEEVLTVGNHADGPYLLMRMRAEKPDRAVEAEELLRRSAGNRIGQNIAAVDWAGRVYPDQFWRNYTLGNILQKPFGQIWQDQSDPVLNILRHKKEYKDPKCGRCRWFDLCGGNFRSLTGSADLDQWQNQPPCYLSEEEIRISNKTVCHSREGGNPCQSS
jgi:radical SAM protein with 4Fe4S-binding SPASM domain